MRVVIAVVATGAVAVTVDSAEIEESGDPNFLEELAIALGDTEQYLALRKDHARSLSAKSETEDSSPE